MMSCFLNIFPPNLLSGSLYHRSFLQTVSNAYLKSPKAGENIFSSFYLIKIKEIEYGSESYDFS